MNENTTPEMRAFKRWFVLKYEDWERLSRPRRNNDSSLNLRRLLKSTVRLYGAIKADAELDTTADWVADAWISFLLHAPRGKNEGASTCGQRAQNKSL
jgi:hypothetical protein